ncbi:hypothetical protein TL16_g04565 [Triparma laevis f. inornata]|uniref:Uncharacterized protein n=1 Tax=Triparma laevis f. inornata TaxID=1714386 RepID=A0A9W7AEP3_9STRA|nr:hypothetical protein TL16_g04565 [Triparma laevis f. inornata]
MKTPPNTFVIKKGQKHKSPKRGVILHFCIPFHHHFLPLAQLLSTIPFPISSSHFALPISVAFKLNGPGNQDITPVPMRREEGW